MIIICPGLSGARRARRALICAAAGLLAALAWPSHAGQETLAEFLRTGDLICELHAASAAPRRPRRPGMLLVIDQVASRPGAARVLTSRKAGAQAVKVYGGETGVHLVQDLDGSVIVTTLLGCEARSASGRCQRFAAVNAWHFDQSVHTDPDRAFRRLPATSYAGYCEAWHMDEPAGTQ